MINGLLLCNSFFCIMLLFKKIHCWFCATQYGYEGVSLNLQALSIQVYFTDQNYTSLPLPVISWEHTQILDSFSITSLNQLLFQKHSHLLHFHLFSGSSLSPPCQLTVWRIGCCSADGRTILKRQLKQLLTSCANILSLTL